MIIFKQLQIPNHYLCLPIIAQGDTVGLLHIAFDSVMTDSSPLDENLISFAQRCSEQISMAIANVKLRDELHQQSTRDPLTGLFWTKAAPRYQRSEEMAEQ